MKNCLPGNKPIPKNLQFVMESAFEKGNYDVLVALIVTEPSRFSGQKSRLEMTSSIEGRPD